MLVLLESHLLDLVYLLTCCFHQKIVLLSIPILTRLEEEHLSCLNFASIGYAHDYLRHNHYWQHPPFSFQFSFQFNSSMLFLTSYSKINYQPCNCLQGINKNFENVREQLNQPVIPVWCDDGVFSPAMDIVLSRPKYWRTYYCWDHFFRQNFSCVVQGVCLQDLVDNFLKEYEVYGSKCLHDKKCCGCRLRGDPW